MTRSVFIYSFLIALILTACSATPTESPKSDLPPLNSNWEIKMTHSGGIMGLSRSIDASSNGSYTVTDERTNKTVNGELDTDELSKLTTLISFAKYSPAVRPDGMACADCFIYNLEIHGGNGNFRANLNDISLPNSGLASLVDTLRGIIDSALK